MNNDQSFVYVNDKLTSLSAYLAMKREDIKTLDASGCTALTAIDAPVAKTLDASGCTALTAIDAPVAKTLYARGCTALTAIDAPVAKIDRNPYVYGGTDARGYLFEGVMIRNQWRVLAGCRNFLIEDAREHWGAGGDSDRPDCLAIVERIAAAIDRLETSKQAEE